MSEKLIPFDPADFSAERIRHARSTSSAVRAEMWLDALVVLWNSGDVCAYDINEIDRDIRLTAKMRVVQCRPYYVESGQNFVGFVSGDYGNMSGVTRWAGPAFDVEIVE